MSGISALGNVSNNFDSDIGTELPELKAKPSIITKTTAILLTAAKIILQSTKKMQPGEIQKKAVKYHQYK